MKTIQDAREYYLRNRQKIIDRSKKRYSEKKDEIKPKNRKYYLHNRELINKKRRESRAKNIKKSRERYIYDRQLRRARLNNVMSEKYNRLEIYKKFGGYCIVCDEKIHLKYKHPHRMAFTIHHLIPIKLGGDDLIGNIAPAHFKCNVSVGIKKPIMVIPKVYYG